MAAAPATANPIRKSDFSDVHRIADRLQPGLRRRLLAALQALSDAISLETIETLLSAGDVTGVMSLLPSELADDLAAALRSTSEAAAVGTAQLETVSVGLSFDLVNPRAVRWAENHAARLVTQVSSDMRAAISDVVIRGQVEGITAARQARMIRNSIGLTRRQAAALNRYVASFDDDRLAARQGDRRRARMIRQRAETIARTETIRAANMGQQLTWQAAQDAGTLAQDARKVWIVTTDDRLCPICAPLEGQTVAVAESFVSTERATEFAVLSRTGEDRVSVVGRRPLPRPIVTETPPAHPRCRCAVGIAI